MTRIGLLSDTHSFLDEQLFSFFENCDEIWHAGDIGDVTVADRLSDFKPFKAVYGNIDGPEIRHRYPEILRFDCESVPVFIIHIGGYPGRYVPKVRKAIQEHPPKLYICGHSHILKVMPDRSLDLLHMNPGACGHEGFHKVRTALRFTIEGTDIHSLELIELGKRGSN